MKKNAFRHLKILRQPVYREFHNFTKLVTLPEGLDPKKWPEKWKKVFFKGYPRLPELVLPSPSKLIRKKSLHDALFRRQSVINFSKDQLDKQELADLVYYSAGVKRFRQPWAANRFYPSAGSRYPLEIYPVVLNVRDIREGIYHYYIKNHSLEVLLNKSFKRVIFSNFNQKWIKDAALLVIISAVFRRMTMKYGDRGYRHILTEVGHLSQNFYLNSVALGLGCCSIGGYIDDGLNKLFDIDGVEETVMGVMAFGKPKG